MIRQKQQYELEQRQHKKNQDEKEQVQETENRAAPSIDTQLRNITASVMKMNVLSVDAKRSAGKVLAKAKATIISSAKAESSSWDEKAVQQVFLRAVEEEANGKSGVEELLAAVRSTLELD